MEYSFKRRSAFEWAKKEALGFPTERLARNLERNGANGQTARRSPQPRARRPTPSRNNVPGSGVLAVPTGASRTRSARVKPAPVVKVPSALRVTTGAAEPAVQIPGIVAAGKPLSVGTVLPSKGSSLPPHPRISVRAGGKKAGGSENVAPAPNAWRSTTL